MSGFAALAGKHGITVAQVNEAWAQSQKEAASKGLKKGTEGHSNKTMQLFRAKLKALGASAQEAEEAAAESAEVVVAPPVVAPVEPEAEPTVVKVINPDHGQELPFDDLISQQNDDATWHGNS